MQHDCYNIDTAYKSEPNMMQLISIDSASTSDIIANQSIPQDIHQVENPLMIISLVKKSRINKQGQLKNYLPCIWFYPNGRVNILLLNNIQKY